MYIIFPIIMTFNKPLMTHSTFVCFYPNTDSYVMFACLFHTKIPHRIIQNWFYYVNIAKAVPIGHWVVVAAVCSESSAVASTPQPQLHHHGQSTERGKIPETIRNSHYRLKIQDNIIKIKTSSSELGEVWDGGWDGWDLEVEEEEDSGHPTSEDWSTDPDLGGPESGHATMDEVSENEEVVERGDEEVKFWVVMPTKLWLLPLDQWATFGQHHLFSLMREYFEGVFPTISPLHEEDLWIIRRNLLCQTGQDYLP